MRLFTECHDASDLAPTTTNDKCTVGCGSDAVDPAINAFASLIHLHGRRIDDS